MNDKTVTVFVNSGKTPEARKELAQTIQTAFDKLNIKTDITVLMKGQDYAAIAEQLVEKAKSQGNVAIAAGGDGSVNLLAGLCYKHDVTLGIIPLGTFNYFARNMKIPTELKAAIEVIAKGHTQNATLGFLNDRIFLNKVSFGLWAKLIRHREEASSRFGRARIVAVFAAFYSMLQWHKSLHLTIEGGGQQRQIKTPMMFVCNNTLQLEKLGVAGAECTRNNQLAIVAMKKANRFQIMRFMAKGLLKMLAKEERLTEFCAGNFTLSTGKSHIELVIDGEIVRFATPLKFHIKADALRVLTPSAT